MMKHILKSLNLFLLSSLFLSNVSIVHAEVDIKKLKETVDFVGRARKELKDAEGKWVACSRKECQTEKAASDAAYKTVKETEGHIEKREKDFWNDVNSHRHSYEKNQKADKAHKSCLEIQCGGRARKEDKDAEDKWVACSRKECTEEKAAAEAAYKDFNAYKALLSVAMSSRFLVRRDHKRYLEKFQKADKAHKSCLEIQCWEEDERMKKAARKVARFEIAKRAKELRHEIKKLRHEIGKAIAPGLYTK